MCSTAESLLGFPPRTDYIAKPKLLARVDLLTRAVTSVHEPLSPPPCPIGFVDVEFAVPRIVHHEHLAISPRNVSRSRGNSAAAIVMASCCGATARCAPALAVVALRGETGRWQFCLEPTAR